MKTKTINYMNGEADESVDILILYKMMRNPDYNVIYVCKNKTSLDEKREQFINIIKKNEYSV